MKEVAAFSGSALLSTAVVTQIRNERGQQLTWKTSDEPFGQFLPLQGSGPVKPSVALRGPWCHNKPLEPAAASLPEGWVSSQTSPDTTDVPIQRVGTLAVKMALNWVWEMMPCLDYMFPVILRGSFRIYCFSR